MCSGLRVLHVASQVEGIRVVLKALGKLIPTLTNVLWVGLLFYYIFAVRSGEAEARVHQNQSVCAGARRRPLRGLLPCASLCTLLPAC